MNELKQRCFWGSLLVLSVILLIAFSHHPIWGWGATIAVAFISWKAFTEFAEMLKVRGVSLPLPLKILAFFVPFFWHINPLSVAIAPLIALLLLFIYQLHAQKNPLATIASGFFGFCYIAIGLSFFIPILHASIGWMVFLLVVTKSADIAALFTGKKWGKHPLCPNVSPKKTWEGAIGGLVASLACSFLLTILHVVDLSWEQAFGLGLLIGVFSEVGDLAESLIKRDLGVKDSSRSLPGLGGVLDIVDSLLWTTPFCYFYLRSQGVL